MIKTITILIVSLCFIISCATLKPYEQVYINDPDMDFSIAKIDRFEIYFHTYREAASGANGHKTGGGCGCN